MFRKNVEQFQIYHLYQKYWSVLQLNNYKTISLPITYTNLSNQHVASNTVQKQLTYVYRMISFRLFTAKNLLS